MCLINFLSSLINSEKLIIYQSITKINRIPIYFIICYRSINMSDIKHINNMLNCVKLIQISD